MEGNLDKIVPYGPVVHPTEAQFKDFKKFVYGLAKNPEYLRAGAVKVVPPKSFRFQTPKIQELLKTLTIPHPLEQQIQTGRGFYDLRLTSKKALSCSEYKKKVDEDAKFIKGLTPQQIERQVA